MQFRLRSLLILMTFVAVLTMPTYRYCLEAYHKWNGPTDSVKQATVVTVPKGGYVISGGRISYVEDGKSIQLSPEEFKSRLGPVIFSQSQTDPKRDVRRVKELTESRFQLFSE